MIEVSLPSANPKFTSGERINKKKHKLQAGGKSTRSPSWLCRQTEAPVREISPTTQANRSIAHSKSKSMLSLNTFLFGSKLRCNMGGSARFVKNALLRCLEMGRNTLLEYMLYGIIRSILRLIGNRSKKSKKLNR